MWADESQKDSKVLNPPVVYDALKFRFAGFSKNVPGMRKSSYWPFVYDGLLLSISYSGSYSNHTIF